MQYVDPYLYDLIRASRGEFPALNCFCTVDTGPQHLQELLSIMVNATDETIEIAVDLACRCAVC